MVRAGAAPLFGQLRRCWKLFENQDGRNSIKRWAGWAFLPCWCEV